jgi:Spy/CpxP family protein refolding chaperone
MKSARILGPLTLVLMVVFAASAYAQGCCGGGRFGGLGPATAKLTAEQRKQVDSIRLDFLKKTEDIRSQMRKKRIELMELRTKATPDENAVDQVRQEIWALQDRMIKERREMSRAVDKLLTPEQRRSFSRFGRGGMGRFGRGGGFCRQAGGGLGRGFGGCPGRSRVF